MFLILLSNIDPMGNLYHFHIIFLRDLLSISILKIVNLDSVLLMIFKRGVDD